MNGTLFHTVINVYNVSDVKVLSSFVIVISYTRLMQLMDNINVTFVRNVLTRDYYRMPLLNAFIHKYTLHIIILTASQ